MSAPGALTADTTLLVAGTAERPLLVRLDPARRRLVTAETRPAGRRVEKTRRRAHGAVRAEALLLGGAVANGSAPPLQAWHYGRGWLLLDPQDRPLRDAQHGRPLLGELDGEAGGVLDPARGDRAVTWGTRGTGWARVNLRADPAAEEFGTAIDELFALLEHRLAPGLYRSEEARLPAGRANPAPATATLEVYRGAHTHCAMLRLAGATPRHWWLRAALNRSAPGTAWAKGPPDRVDFHLERCDDERTSVVRANAYGRIFPDGRQAWDDASRVEASARGVNHERKLPGWAGAGAAREPWLLREYGALYDWLLEQLAARLPPVGSLQAHPFTVPLEELPEVVRRPARLAAESPRARGARKAAR